MTARVEMQAAWDLHEGLVIGTACKFYRSFGGDLREITADAFYLFTTACHSYEEKAPLSYWIRQRVWWGLLDERRRKLKRFRHEKVDSVPEQSYEERHEYDWRDNLSEDAREVVEVALDPPPDVLCLRSDRPCKRVAQHMIHQYLRDCGWTKRRIRKAFREVEQLVA